MRLGEIIRILAPIAAEQHGFVTRRQAVAAGVTDVDLHRAATTGWLQRQQPGLYRAAGTPTHPNDPVFGRWHALNPTSSLPTPTTHPHAIAAGVTALAVWEIVRLPATYEFVVPRRTHSSDPHLRLAVRAAHPEPHLWRDGITTQPPARALTWARRRRQIAPAAADRAAAHIAALAAFEALK